MSLPYQTFDEFSTQHGLRRWVLYTAFRRGILPELAKLGRRTFIPTSKTDEILGELRKYKYIRSESEKAERRKNGYVYVQTSKALATAAT